MKDHRQKAVRQAKAADRKAEQDEQCVVICYATHVCEEEQCPVDSDEGAIFCSKRPVWDRC